MPRQNLKFFGFSKWDLGVSKWVEMNSGFRFGRFDQTGKCNMIEAFLGGSIFRVLFEIGRGLNFLQFWAVTATRRGVAARVVS